MGRGRRGLVYRRMETRKLRSGEMRCRRGFINDNAVSPLNGTKAVGIFRPTVDVRPLTPHLTIERHAARARVRPFERIRRGILCRDHAQEEDRQDRAMNRLRQHGDLLSKRLPRLNERYYLPALVKLQMYGAYARQIPTPV